jgi:hypothetical protein
MRKRRAENSIWLTREKAREFIWLSLLAASSLLLSKASHALAGDAEMESGGRSSSGEAYWRVSSASERIAGVRSAAAIAIAGKNPERSYTLAAGELVTAVIANELTDREQSRKWICTIEKRAGKQTQTQVQVETKDGPLYRLLAIDGMVLNPIQRQQDDARIGKLIKDPRPLLKLKQAQYEDEIKLQKLISLMPQPCLRL